MTHLKREFILGDQTVRALNDIDLTIAEGEYLSVMGPSGSGKSTLLNMIGLLDTPTAGHYYLSDTDTGTLKESERAALRRSHIGFVFQSYHLIPRLTAWENIELPLMLSGMAHKLRVKKVDEVVDRMGLLERAYHLPNQLSGGQRQRVAIGRALIMNPELILADEPTGNLDTASGNEVVRVLESLNRDGITLIVVTHDVALGGRAQRQLKMVDGKIVEDHSIERAVTLS